VENVSYIRLEDEDVVRRHKPHPRFRRLAFHLAGAKELDIPSEMKLVARANDHTRPQAASQALQTLVTSHMSFLEGIAAQVAVKNDMAEAEEDLISEAISSFIRTIRRYRGEANGARLATYATYTVSGDLMSYALRNREAYAVGTNSPDRVMIFGYEDFTSTFKIQHKVDFNVDTPGHVALLADIAEVSEKSVRRVCAQRRNRQTIDIEEIEIEDTARTSNPEVIVLHDSTAAAVRQVMQEVTHSLKPRDRDILTALLEDHAIDFSILGSKHGITRERVGQIYRSAVSDIRDRLTRAGITSN